MGDVIVNLRLSSNDDQFAKVQTTLLKKHLVHNQNIEKVDQEFEELKEYESGGSWLEILNVSVINSGVIIALIRMIHAWLANKKEAIKNSNKELSIIITVPNGKKIEIHSNNMEDLNKLTEEIQRILNDSKDGKVETK
ncbi:effector-associated constant component EACC1 [Mangrovivirga cuniculi]|uniref:Uncharacterized protein n=1 Tax=Mangrovivirga cuniculi TaxID=2715131 RepID=A0A4D7JKH2_9BACT|nr:hypothetical protein [Mangrovivirga cuniculi]QCK15197.1 hypothetical protein DCC35_10780 [Mangrovivirga cuniculi]